MLSKETKDRLIVLARRDAAHAEESLRLVVRQPNTEVEQERYKAWMLRASKVVIELEKEWASC